MEDKFQKKTLDKKDHEKEDKRAKNIRKGAGITAIAVTVGLFVAKILPGLIDSFKKN